MKNLFSTQLLFLFFGINSVFSGQLDPKLVDFIRSQATQTSSRMPSVQVMVSMNRQFDVNVIRAQLSATSRSAHIANDAVFSELRQQTRAQQASFIQSLSTLEREGLIVDTHAFWVINAVSLRASADVLQAIADLPEVSTVILDAAQSFLPEPLTARQNDHAISPPTELGKPWALDYVKGSVAAKRRLSGAGVEVHVIDTGIDDTHQAFEKGQILVQKSVSFVAGEDFRDRNGHGTHCAGIIGSKKFGLATGVKLVAVRVLDGSGFGTLRSVIQGIEYSVSHGAQVVNMSLASHVGGGLDDPRELAVSNAVKGGVIMVLAEGNSGPKAPTIDLPGGVSPVITVGATNRLGVIAKFSGQGNMVYGDDKPAVFAPGVDIESASLGDGTGLMSGASMASPLVAALAALIVEKWHKIYLEALWKEGAPRMAPYPTAEFVKRIIVESVTGQEVTNVYGAGIIDCEAALNMPFAGGPLQPSLLQRVNRILRRVFS